MGISIESIKEVAQTYQGNIEHLNRLKVFTNSRTSVQDGLFIPIVGERFDGHDFLMDAIKAGAVASLWENGRSISDDIPDDFVLFFVDDTTKAMQKLATLRRREVGATIVAITGSNGKTTSKDIVAEVLSTTFRTHKTVGNLNNHFGVPYTLLDLEDDCEACVIEMGMNHFGEIELLSQIAEPDIAIITNIGESHIEFLGSRAGIAKAKMEIVAGLSTSGVLIIDGDEPLLTDFEHKRFKAKVIKCGFGPSNDLNISLEHSSEKGASFTVNQQPYTVPLLGRHNVKNAVYAVAVANILRVPSSNIQRGFSELNITGMRLETSNGLDGTLLINDAYNASPTSMKAALETLAALPNFSRKVAVLGDMYELGGDEEALHSGVAEAITDDITDLVTIGEKGAWIAEKALELKLGSTIKSFKIKEEAFSYLSSLASPETAMLFKASRLVKLETLVTALKGGNVS